MGKKLPRFYVSVGAHTLFATDEYKKDYAFMATARERIQKGIAKGADMPRLRGFGKTELDAVTNLHEQIKSSKLDACLTLKMSRAIRKWVKSQALVNTPTQAGICGVDQHNAQNAAAWEAANDGEVQDAQSTTEPDLPHTWGTLICLVCAINRAEVFERMTIQGAKAFCSTSCYEKWSFALTTRPSDKLAAPAQTEPANDAAPETAKAEWHTITSAGRQIQRGIVPTQWGEVRVSLGELGEPGGSFEGKECAAFSFWFEGWEYYDDSKRNCPPELAERSAQGFASEIARGEEWTKKIRR